MSVIETALPDEPLEALRFLAASESELDRIRRAQVGAARAAGASWQQIGDALGISRQSAWEAFTETARNVISSNAAANESLRRARRWTLPSTKCVQSGAAEPDRLPLP